MHPTAGDEDFSLPRSFPVTWSVPVSTTEELKKAFQAQMKKISVELRREEKRKEDSNMKYFRELNKGVDNMLHTDTH